MQRLKTRSAVWSVVIGAMVLAYGVVGIAQTPDPAVGTWKLNVAKSKFSPGPAPKSATVVIAPAGKGLEVAIEAVGPDGTPAKWGYTTTGDGKDAPVTGNPMYDAVASTRTDPSHGTMTYKKDAKPIMTVTTAVSADGKTLTTTSKGTNPEGKPVHNVAVYDKQ
jgi:hypothetical protein